MHLILQIDINMAMKFLGLMNKLNNWIRRNGNTLWGDATALESGQIDEYVTFINKGHHTKTSPPNRFKKIRAHLVFDVKHYGRHKARLVADRHIT
jgi:hypothetical protein